MCSMSLRCVYPRDDVQPFMLLACTFTFQLASSLKMSFGSLAANELYGALSISDNSTGSASLASPSLPVYKSVSADDSKRRKLLKPADQMACKSLNPLGCSKMFDGSPQDLFSVCDCSGFVCDR